ncbi:hypothetical protein [Streptomyces sp. CNQ085]|nr:hypothetical protein [Streptomyces sp. CNQ085]MCI0385190.1 hypothetical protein [Streptomyces sp. CNQ085]
MPALSLVAEGPGGEVVGHVVRTLAAYDPEDPAPRRAFTYAEPFGRV